MHGVVPGFVAAGLYVYACAPGWLTSSICKNDWPCTPPCTLSHSEWSIGQGSTFALRQFKSRLWVAQVQWFVKFVCHDAGAASRAVPFPNLFAFHMPAQGAATQCTVLWCHLYVYGCFALCSITVYHHHNRSLLDLPRFWILYYLIAVLTTITQLTLAAAAV